MNEHARNETRQEARILSVLKHSYIINFREVFTTVSNKLCIVMDYAEGGDLQCQIRKARENFPESLILDWFTQICLGLKHVHDRKILHRDIKAQNIFLTSNNCCLLGDFGIAKVLNNTQGLTKTMVGTPYHLSPEMIDRKGYSFQSDVWALGVLLYELCALKPPFDATSLHELALKIVGGKYVPIPAQYSTEMRILIEKLLAVDPAKRPTVNQILNMKIIKARVKSLLNENEYNSEFSHTILHEVNVMRRGKAKDVRQNTKESLNRDKESYREREKRYRLEEKRIEELKQEIQKMKLEEMERNRHTEMKQKQVEELKARLSEKLEVERKKIEESGKKHIPKLVTNYTQTKRTEQVKFVPVMQTPRVKVNSPLEGKMNQRNKRVVPIVNKKVRKQEDKFKESVKEREKKLYVQKATVEEKRKQKEKERNEERMKMRKYIQEERKKLALLKEKNIFCDIVVKDSLTSQQLYKNPNSNKNSNTSKNAIQFDRVNDKQLHSDDERNNKCGMNSYLHTYKEIKAACRDRAYEVTEDCNQSLKALRKFTDNTFYNLDKESTAESMTNTREQYNNDKELICDYLHNKFGTANTRKVVSHINRAVILFNDNVDK